MATRILSRRKLAAPVLAGALTAGLLYPRTKLHADAPPSEQSSTVPTRKPIYSSPDSPSPSSSPPTSKSPSSSDSSDTTSSKPDTSTTTTTTRSTTTPTQFLAAHIRLVRLRTHTLLSATESQVNTLLSQLLRTEESVLARLAALPAGHEPVLPSSLYVLVAALSGSIVTRNRNILLRFSAPLVLGLGTAWVVMPHTMANVSQLVGEIEEGVSPRLREGHITVVAAVGESVRYSRERAQWGVEWSRGLVKKGRETVEGAVRGEGKGDGR